nr:D-alanyl-lipoteichoic acid biosynthesis protein DltD [Collinsella urealyticum]
MYRRAALVGLALVLGASGIAAFGAHAKAEASEPAPVIVTYPVATQLTNFDFITQSLANRRARGEHPKLLFGSSELAPDLAGPAHPARLFTNGRYDIDVAVMGRAGTADLWSAIEMGALAPQLDDKRLVFVVSLQWFMSYRNPKSEFPGLFSEGAYHAFMDNPDISQSLKERITSRMAEYGVDRRAGSTPVGAWVERIDGNASNLLADLRQATDTNLATAPGAQTLPVQASGAEASPESLEAQPITQTGDPDWPAIFDRAEADAKARSANNSLGFYDTWYQKKFKTWERGAKDSWQKFGDGSYLSEQEFEDFGMLLEVCREAHIKPLILIQPVKGAAYDQTIYTAQVRKEYYDRIRAMCGQAQVPVADFSDHEYDRFFLRDYSHPSDLGGAYYAHAIYAWFTTGEADTSRPGA